MTSIILKNQDLYRCTLCPILNCLHIWICEEKTI